MKYLYTILLSSFSFALFGQIVANPYTGAIDLTPNSGVDNIEGTFDCDQTMAASFNLGISGLEDADVTEAQLTFTVGIAGWEYPGAMAGNDASSFISGEWDTLFSYIFTDANTILATQIKNIPATGPDPLNPIQGDIVISLHVPEMASTGSNLAINVNLQVPGYFSGNVQADDNESTTGDVVCPAAEIRGKVMVTDRADNGPDSTFQGVKIYLFTDADVLLDSMITDENGAYAFTGLSDGGYYVTQVQPSGFTSVSDQDMQPEAGDFVDLVDNAVNGFPVNDTIPVSLLVDEIDMGNDFVEAPMAALPVILSAFNARALDCEVIVKWSTQSEINASHMTLQMSKDGRTFENIETLAANRRSSTYTVTVGELNSSRYFFRLIQVDLDGESQYSVIRSVYVEGCGEDDEKYLSLYPNPVISNGQLNVEFNDENMTQVSIITQNGQIARLINLGPAELGFNSRTIEIGNLSAGMYILRSNTGISKRFIVTE